MGRKRRTFSSSFKHKVAVEALTERHTLSELAQKYELHPNQIVKWKQVLQKEGQHLFEKSRGPKSPDQEQLISRLYEQIGQLQFELNWLKKKLAMSNEAKRLAISSSNAKLSIQRQCELLGLSRSTYYWEPQPASEENLRYMRLIDEQHLKRPFYGSPRMTAYLRTLGYVVNEKRIARLMRLMGIRAVQPRKHRALGQNGQQHKIYPYLLRNMPITRNNQVWSTDITYVPMPGGFLYLMAVIDWHSRYVLSWEVSNSMERHFCLEGTRRALEKYTQPEIFNTDQGSQFTSQDFTDLIESNGIAMSMDGKGRAIDNVFVERLWRSVKYEDIYLKEYSDGKSLYRGLKDYFTFYNFERPHQSLGYKTPAEIYFNFPDMEGASPLHIGTLLP
ncbi:MAG: IS3 family transposase [Bacteroidota bacterium]